MSFSVLVVVVDQSAVWMEIIGKFEQKHFELIFLNLSKKVPCRGRDFAPKRES